MLIEQTLEEGLSPSSSSSVNQDLFEFKRSVKNNSLSLINNSIKSKGFPPEMTNAMFIGKMTRSILVFTIGKSFNVNYQRMINIASSIEILHEASLVHDDIQDRQEYRRNIPTVWKNYSISEAISWGDFLLSISLEPLLDNGNISDIRHFNETIQKMLEGQNLEQTSVGKQISYADYLNIINLKTGSLIELIGILLVNNEIQVKKLLKHLIV